MSSMSHHPHSLGKSGLKVSKVILGAMSYGSSEWQPWVLNEADSLPLLEHAYKCGINTWDTVSCANASRRRG
jgi:aryl-alcohol dehydrogenase-like predicted oxidoreductase